MFRTRLHKRQSYAYHSPANEILYGGAAGGGKSHLFRMAAIAWCLMIPGLQVYFFRRLLPDLKKNHMMGPTSFPMILRSAGLIQTGQASVNHSENFIRFANGSMIHLCHAKEENSVQKYLGADIHVLIIDELTTFTQYMYRFLRSRLRGTEALEIPLSLQGRFPRAMCGTNPGGIGHNWVKAAFIDIAPKGMMRRMESSEGGMLRQFIEAKLQDNPSLDQKEYKEKLEGLGEPHLVKAMLEGDWNIVAGGMFDDVWLYDKIVVPSIPYSELPFSYYYDRTFDWGSSAPFSVGWWAQADGEVDLPHPDGDLVLPKGTLIRIKDWYGWNGRPNEGVKKTNTEIARGIIEREDYIHDVRSRARVKPIRIWGGSADHNIFSVVDGETMLDDYLEEGIDWEKAPKGPGSRVSGWSKMRQGFKNAATYPYENPPILIDERCRHAIRTLPTLPRDDLKTEDVNTKSEDHVADDFRYRVLQGYTLKSKTAKVTGL